MKKKMHIPKTIAESIPYECAYENGILEIREGVYSRSYRIGETNFKTKEDSDQWKMAQEYASFIGSFEEDMTIQVTIHNKTVDIERFKQDILIGMQSDEFNAYRQEYNEMILDKMAGARNNLTSEILLTVSFEAGNIKEAADKFRQIDGSITEAMTHITGIDAPALDIVERLEMINGIYNQDSMFPLYERRMIAGKDVESFSLANCARQGITTKDVIAPPSLEFKAGYFKTGTTYGRSYYISNYPNWLKGTVMTDFASIGTSLLVSVYFNMIPQDKAYKLIRTQNINISSAILERQKKSPGIDPNLISPELREAKDEADALKESMAKENARLFVSAMVITLFASTKEELNRYEQELHLKANRNLITVKPLIRQQEAGFNSSLPLANNSLIVQSLMTTDTVAAVIPFSVMDVRQQTGFYYGINPVSNNLIIYDRTSSVNPNGCILGMPGVGKSFKAKEEMINVILNSNDEIYIIDPEREYTPIAESLGGSVVRLANGSDRYINPFDLNLENADEGGDPVKVKSDFIETVCEIAIGGKYGLAPIEKSLIGRCVMQVYEDHIRYLNETGRLIDTKTAPTMKDFYQCLLLQSEREAADIALALERFVNGSLDIFSHHTNIDITNRFTVYDVKEIGSGLKELGLQIALDNIWNKMIQNKECGKRTWVYIDEFHFLMNKPSSAEYISQIWKRARKWNGIPTAITQNVEDMLKSNDARTIINNSPFVVMLGQSDLNKRELSKLLGISPVEQKYISAAKPGMGLLKIGDSIIPMDDKFPQKTRLYQIMTTKPDETIGL